MIPRWRALVVDDERLARRRLIRLLAYHEDIEVVGEAESVSAALVALEKHRPDVVFLDIQMPGGDGFSLLERSEVEAHIIFVTAFDEHALRAFEVNALDYLMKPVAPTRLATCVGRIGKAPATGTNAPIRAQDRVYASTARGARFVALSEVMAIRAAGDYTELCLRDGSAPMSRSGLGDWERRLEGSDFLRIHRSALVRVTAVERLERTKSGARVFVQHVEEPLVVSRREVKRVQDRLRATVKT